MSNSLIEIIRTKRALITKLQKELDEALKELTSAPTDHPPGKHSAKKNAPHEAPAAPALFPNNGDSAVLSTSSVGRTIEVLREAGRPLTTDDIIFRIQMHGHTVKKATLVGNLSRYVKHKKVFYRAAPSTFGLLEHRR